MERSNSVTSVSSRSNSIEGLSRSPSTDLQLKTNDVAIKPIGFFGSVLLKAQSLVGRNYIQLKMKDNKTIFVKIDHIIKGLSTYKSPQVDGGGVEMIWTKKEVRRAFGGKDLGGLQDAFALKEMIHLDSRKKSQEGCDSASDRTGSTSSSSSLGSLTTKSDSTDIYNAGGIVDVTVAKSALDSYKKGICQDIINSPGKTIPNLTKDQLKDPKILKTICQILPKLTVAQLKVFKISEAVYLAIPELTDDQMDDPKISKIICDEIIKKPVEVLSVLNTNYIFHKEISEVVCQVIPNLTLDQASIGEELGGPLTEKQEKAQQNVVEAICVVIDENPKEVIPKLTEKRLEGTVESSRILEAICNAIEEKPLTIIPMLTEGQLKNGKILEAIARSVSDSRDPGKIVSKLNPEQLSPKIIDAMCEVIVRKPWTIEGFMPDPPESQGPIEGVMKELDPPGKLNALDTILVKRKAPELWKAICNAIGEDPLTIIPRLTESQLKNKGVLEAIAKAVSSSRDPVGIISCLDQECLGAPEISKAFCNVIEKDPLTIIPRLKAEHLKIPGISDAICNAIGKDPLRIIPKTAEDLLKNEGILKAIAGAVSQAQNPGEIVSKLRMRQLKEPKIIEAIC
ncbi:MAG: hypothetical protein V4489_07250 [Chlamydiota bacterium]